VSTTSTRAPRPLDTYTVWPSGDTTTPLADGPVAIGMPAVRVAVSMGIRVPSSSHAMPRGRRPTRTEATALRAATSITSTCVPSSAPTWTQRPSGLKCRCASFSVPSYVAVAD